MDLEAEVAALPGGAELAAMVAEVQKLPALLRSTATGLTATSVDAADATSVIRRAVAQLGLSWTGSASAAFNTYMTGFHVNSTAFHQSTHQAAAILTQTVGALEQLESAILTIAGNLILQVAQVRAVWAGATSDGLDAEISALVSDATQAARSLMLAFEQQAAAAVNALYTELPVISTAFTGTSPAPGSGDTALSPGLILEPNRPQPILVSRTPFTTPGPGEPQTLSPGLIAVSPTQAHDPAQPLDPGFIAVPPPAK